MLIFEYTFDIYFINMFLILSKENKVNNIILDLDILCV